MRPKVVLTLIACALAVISAALILKPRKENAVPPPPVAEAPATSEVVNASPPPAPAPLPVTPPPQPAHVMTDDERQSAIDAEVGRLQDWSMNNDPASLSNILLDLTNSEKDVRDAAIEATKQFDSTNAIPTLKAVAMNTTDTDEQIALLEAVKFLELPPLTFSPPTPEQIQAQQQRQAARQAQMQQNQNQAAPPAAPQTGNN